MQKSTQQSKTENTVAWLLALSFIAWLPSLSPADHSRYHQLQAGTYTVSEGESLWSIASRLGGGSTDVTSIVDRIAAVNQLHGAILRPGQQLHIPASIAVVE